MIRDIVMLSLKQRRRKYTRQPTYQDVDVILDLADMNATVGPSKTTIEALVPAIRMYEEAKLLKGPRLGR